MPPWNSEIISRREARTVLGDTRCRHTLHRSRLPLPPQHFTPHKTPALLGNILRFTRIGGAWPSAAWLTRSSHRREPRCLGPSFSLTSTQSQSLMGLGLNDGVIFIVVSCLSLWILRGSNPSHRSISSHHSQTPGFTLEMGTEGFLIWKVCRLEMLDLSSVRRTGAWR